MTAKTIVYKYEVLCARCKHRETCRGIGGPVWTDSKKCDEFQRDWNMILRNEKKLWETNRERKLKPKTGKFWCWGCDAYLVGEWEKCPNCGKRNGQRRNKKE